MSEPAAPQKEAASVLEQVTPTRTDLSWLSMDITMHPRAVPGPKGMRLRDVENEVTAEVPDYWPFLHDHPRGAIPLKTPALAAGYSIFDKVQVWSENAIDLYEDAIYDRWSSATTLPWDTLTPLPDIVEGAIDQICTEISEQAYLDVQVISNWLERISYGFKEVKNYLSTYIFDRVRHTEAFRKRALANGGGLGIEGVGIYHRAILGAMRYHDLMTALLLRALWTQTVCEALSERAVTAVDRQLFSLTARDCGRHVAYIFGMIQYALSRDAEAAPNFHFSFIRHQLLWVADWERSTAFNEAFVIAAADTAAEGHALLEQARARFVRSLLDGLDGAGLTGHSERLHPKLKTYLPESATATA